jgi:hypothetical protein
MSQNGKGSKARPLSLSKEEFDKRLENTFGESVVKKYADLSNLRNEVEMFEEYQKLLKSGMFFEIYPDLTGEWQRDKFNWYNIKAKQS